jgi:hypothetical protein
VKRWKNIANHNDQGLIKFLHDEMDQNEIGFKFHKFWSSR